MPGTKQSFRQSLIGSVTQLECKQDAIDSAVRYADRAVATPTAVEPLKRPVDTTDPNSAVEPDLKRQKVKHEPSEPRQQPRKVDLQTISPTM